MSQYYASHLDLAPLAASTSGDAGARLGVLNIRPLVILLFSVSLNVSAVPREHFHADFISNSPVHAVFSGLTGLGLL